MFQVISKSRYSNSTFVLATFATIQEANGYKAKLNAAPSLTHRGQSVGGKYTVAQVS